MLIVFKEVFSIKELQSTCNVSLFNPQPSKAIICQGKVHQVNKKNNQNKTYPKFL